MAAKIPTDQDHHHQLDEREAVRPRNHGPLSLNRSVQSYPPEYPSCAMVITLYKDTPPPRPSRTFFHACPMKCGIARPDLSSRHRRQSACKGARPRAASDRARVSTYAFAPGAIRMALSQRVTEDEIPWQFRVLLSRPTAC